MAANIAEVEYLTLSEITFEWGDSYDDKDWIRLRAILAPTLMVSPPSIIPLFTSNMVLGRLYRCQWAQMGRDDRRGVCRHNVSHWLRR